jgi:diketogulonate reductase-like aldo/keto reductase
MHNSANIGGMMRTEKSVNYAIDWLSVSNPSTSELEQITKIQEDRKHYFDMLRRLLQDLKNLGIDAVDEVLESYNVHFVDIDDFPRVNIDEPT